MSKTLKRDLRKACLLILVVMLMVTSLPMTAFGAVTGNGTITLTIGSSAMTINGVTKNIDSQGAKPVIINDGYTMLPLRAVVEGLGGTVTWSEAKQSITIALNGQTTVVTIGSKTAYVDGVAKTMGAAPYISNDRTLAWIRIVEFFKGVTCSWTKNADDTTNKIMVNYSFGNSEKTVYVNNNTDNKISDIHFAPTGTTSKSSDLLSTDLAKGGNASFGYTFVLPYKYDIYATYSSGDKIIYKNVDFTGISTYANLILNADGTFAIGVDSTATVKKATKLTFTNNSGVKLTGLYISKKSTTSAWNSATNLLSSSLNNGGSSTATIYLDSEKDWYFRAIDSDGIKYTGSVTFKSTDLSSATLKLTDYSDNSFTLTDQNTTDTGIDTKTKLTFKNDSGLKIYELFMSTTDRNSTWEKQENILPRSVADSSSREMQVALDGDTKWYFMAVDGDDNTYVGQVAFNTGATSATLTLSDDADDSFALSKQVSSGSSNLTALTFKNSSGVKISEFYMSLRDTSARWSSADNLISSSVASGNLRTIDVDLDKETVWYFMAVDNSGTSYKGKVTFTDEKMTAATLTLEDDSDDSFALSKQITQDGGDYTAITFRNRSGISISELYISYRNTTTRWNEADDLLSGTIRDDAEYEFDIELGDDTSWYFRAVDRSGDTYTGKVEFDSNSVTSAVLTLNSDADDSFRLTNQR